MTPLSSGKSHWPLQEKRGHLNSIWYGRIEAVGPAQNNLQLARAPGDLPDAPAPGPLVSGGLVGDPWGGAGVCGGTGRGENGEK